MAFVLIAVPLKYCCRSDSTQATNGSTFGRSKYKTLVLWFKCHVMMVGLMWSEEGDTE